jgi:Holliday junction resolvase RusA-like endonuclease
MASMVPVKQRFQFLIPGEPVANKAPKFARAGGHVRAYKHSSVIAWQTRATEIIKAAWGDLPAIDEPCEVLIVAVFRRPGRLAAKRHGDERVACDRGKDCDNIAKICLDALQWGGALKNDSRVQRLVVEKWYASRNEAPMVAMEVACA